MCLPARSLMHSWNSPSVPGVEQENKKKKKKRHKRIHILVTTEFIFQGQRRDYQTSK